jgi:2,4-dichlorophenol 6-monooxygenase
LVPAGEWSAGEDDAARVAGTVPALVVCGQRRRGGGGSMHGMRTLRTEVMILGGGPTGLVAALALDRLGVDCVVVERRAARSTHPKAHELAGRSLEILADLGVGFEELAREASPDDDASRVVFCETLGREFGRIDLKALPGADKYARHLASPAGYLNLSQVELERILEDHVAGCARATLLRGHAWAGLSQSEEEVVSEVVDADGAPLRVHSRYVIAADGAGSRCREGLGVRMIGPERLREFVSAYFEADLAGRVTTRGKLYFTFTPAAPGVLVAHHVERRWVFHSVVAAPHERAADVDAEVMRARILAALGEPAIDLRILSVSPWQMTAQVAERFRVGRVFLAGDAAHRFPPTGGLGMNSGIADAHNLAWKLAAALRGRAPAALLDAYELERRPVAQTLCDESRRNFERLGDVVAALGLPADAPERVAAAMAARPLAALPAAWRRWLLRRLHRHGARALARVRRDPAVARRVAAAVAEQTPHFDRLGLDLGLAYAAGALLADGSPAPAPADAVRTYVPTTRPGARFPHFWLDGNCRRRSSRELVSFTHSTLVLGADCEVADAEGLAGACARLGARVRSLADVPPGCRDAVHQHAEIAGDGALLIRPDGHVAWRQRGGVRPSAAFLESIVEQAYHHLARA